MKKIDVSTPRHPNVFTLVDDEDYEELIKYKWNTTITPNKDIYVRRVEIKGEEKLEIRMHRQIMGLENLKYNQDILVDHINHNGLDNRRSNLRLCNPSQNMMNRLKKNKSSKSKYKGVHRKTNRNLWGAKITVYKKSIYLGCSKSEKECARRYNEAARKYFGEYACLNKI